MIRYFKALFFTRFNTIERSMLLSGLTLMVASIITLYTVVEKPELDLFWFRLLRWSGLSLIVCALISKVYRAEKILKKKA